MSIHFSSETDNWSTPKYFFDSWNRNFHFKLDACANHDNALCNNYFTKEDDGLSQDWHPYGSVWMNPPYGRDIGKWMEKAYLESCKGCLVVCLVPARTDTRWWNQWATKGIIYFIKGRLKFGGSSASAPFPSAVVVFLGEPKTDSINHLNE